MTSVNRFLLTAGLMFGLTGGLTQFDQEGMAKLGLQLRQLPEALSEYTANLLRRRELELQDQLVLQRLIHKDQLTRDLIAGRVSLLQASAWFLQLNAEAPELSVNTFPDTGASLEEQTCRQVIQWVEMHMRYNPKTRNDALLRQLRQQLAELIALPQGIQLPVMGE